MPALLSKQAEIALTDQKRYPLFKVLFLLQFNVLKVFRFASRAKPWSRSERVAISYIFQPSFQRQAKLSHYFTMQGPILAQHCRRRLRSKDAADQSVRENAAALRRLRSLNPFADSSGNDFNGDAALQDYSQDKLTAWQIGFCGLGGNNSSIRDRRTSAIPMSSLGLFLRLRSSKEAFYLLAAADARLQRPLPAQITATFISAAEGLHGALEAESTAAWRAAVCGAGDVSDIEHEGRAQTPCRVLGVEKMGIENILPELVKCWKLQRETARCASLLGRLLLEAVVKVPSSAEEFPTDWSAALRQAYLQACHWLLASGEPIVECFTRLQETSSHVLNVVISAQTSRASDCEGAEPLVTAPSLISSEEEREDNESYTSSAEVVSLTLEESLSRALYEIYLLPALGVENTFDGQAARAVIAPLLAPIDDRNDQLTYFGGVLLELISYVHNEDMRRFSLPTGLHDVEDGKQLSTSLSTMVVCASRIPWTEYPVALSQALVALDAQDKLLNDSTSSNKSNSSGSSGTFASSGRFTTSTTAHTSPGKQSRLDRPTGAAGRRRREETRHSGDRIYLDGRDIAEEERAGPTIQDWVSAARVVLVSYSEEIEASTINIALGKSRTPPHKFYGLAIDQRVLQLACERHPTLVVPLKVGPGPLAKALLAGDQARPLVAALVRLTSCGGCTGTTGEV